MSQFELCSLGDLLRLERRKVKVEPDAQYAEIGIYSYGRGIFHKQPRSGIEVGDKDLFQIKEGDFIFQITFAWEGAVGLASAAEDGMYGSTRFPTYRVDDTRCYPPFLFNYFKTKPGREQLSRISPGSAGRNRVLSLKRIPEVIVPLPPLDEQRRIVTQIEALAARIEEAHGLRRGAVEEAKAMFAKSMHEVFYPYFDKSHAIGSIFKVTNGSTPSRDNPLYWNGDIKWVSSGEVAFNRIRDTHEKISDLGLANSSAKLYPPNTVLIAMIGQGKTRGQCAILDCYATTNQNVDGIHVYETEHLPEYVYWWLFARYAESRLKEIGTAYPALNGQRVKEMPIPLPSVEVQRRIVAYLDSLQAQVDTLKRLQAETAAELDALLPSVLDKAFQGEL